MVFNTGPYTVLPDNSILITANVQLEKGFPSSHQLKSYVASKSRLKLAARCPVSGCWPSCLNTCPVLQPTNIIIMYVRIPGSNRTTIVSHEEVTRQFRRQNNAYMVPRMRAGTRTPSTLSSPDTHPMGRPIRQFLHGNTKTAVER